MSGWQRWHLPAPCRVNDPSHGTDNINSVHCRSHGSERAGRGASLAAQTRFMNVVEELRLRGCCDGVGRMEGGWGCGRLAREARRRRSSRPGTEVGIGNRGTPHTGVRAAAGPGDHEGNKETPRAGVAGKSTNAAHRISKVTGARIASEGTHARRDKW